MADAGVFARSVEMPRREQIVSQRLSAKSPIRHLDLSLIFVSFALSTFGAVAVYSATRPGLRALGLDGHFFLKRQLVFLALATAAFLVTLLFDYRQLRALSPLLYGAAILLLLAVLSPLGRTVSGAQRWIDFGFLQFQPSEFMKVVLIVALAAMCAEERSGGGSARVLQALGAAMLPALLVYLQPDVGTLMVLAAILMAVLLVSGTRARWMLLTILAGSLAFVLALQFGVLKDYQVARLTAFLDSEADVQRAGYNLAQSKIAIGAGGLTGRGLFRGTQTNLDYVPEQHTDFIFTAIGEETGFVGSMILLGLFGLLLWRCLRIAMLSKDLFGSLLAAGVAGMLVFQIFVNVGMTVGIMPITGIPLPFVSYGGSSLIAGFISVGLLMNVHMRRFV